ncbi:hypothetical protein [Mycolicibacterium monacense]|nr:hypothetical protein [Mycolicibacterium monacense]MDA4104718.1 hypothetical protein [Mycolicibacterium monacense DSM 44395]
MSHGAGAWEVAHDGSLIARADRRGVTELGIDDCALTELKIDGAIT